MLLRRSVLGLKILLLLDNRLEVILRHSRLLAYYRLPSAGNLLRNASVNLNFFWLVLELVHLIERKEARVLTLKGAHRPSATLVGDLHFLLELERVLEVLHRLQASQVGDVFLLHLEEIVQEPPAHFKHAHDEDEDLVLQAEHFVHVGGEAEGPGAPQEEVEDGQGVVDLGAVVAQVVSQELVLGVAFKEEEVLFEVPPVLPESGDDCEDDPDEAEVRVFARNVGPHANVNGVEGFKKVPHFVGSPKFTLLAATNDVVKALDAVGYGGREGASEAQPRVALAVVLVTVVELE